MNHFKVIVFICIGCLFAGGACTKVWESIFTFPKDKTMTGIRVATSECANLGHSYDLPDDQTHRELLRQAVKDKGVAPVWLAIKKNTLGGWTWVNGTKAMATTIRDGTNTEMCGAVSLQESNIVASNCNDDRNGFVCEIRGSRGCTLDHFTQACIQVDTKSYIIGCKIGSWFKARQFCQQYEADLATIDNSATLQKVMKYITDGNYGGVCSWLFIGLSKEDWKVDKISGVTIPRFVNWTAGEPRQDSSLTQLAFSGDTYSWKSARSDLTAAIICQDYSKHLAMIPIPQQTGEKCPDSPECKPTGETGTPTWIFVVIAFGCVCVTAAPFVVFLAWYFCIRSQGKDDKASAFGTTGTDRKGGTGDHELQDVKKPLMADEASSKQKLTSGADEDKPLDVKSEIKGKLSVAIFSEYVNQIEIHDINTLAQSKAEEGIICKEYDKLGNEDNVTPLKVVILPLVKGSIKIETDYAKDQLKQMMDWGIDVVFLTGMEPSKDTELMKLLHDLRSKSVLVCPGNSNKNEFPACETICVGVYNADNQITTGILDFWVKQKEKSVLALAYIAAILNIAKKKDNLLFTHLRDTGNMRKFMIDYVATKYSAEAAGFGILGFKQANIHEGLGKLSDALAKGNKLGLMTKPRTMDDTTWTDLDESLEKLKSCKGYKIHVVIAATPVASATIEQCKNRTHGISFDNPADDEESKIAKNNIGTAVVEYVSTRLKRLSETGEKEPKIHITILPIKTNEIDKSITWTVVAAKLEKLASLKPDIVYISAIGSTPGQGAGIKRQLPSLLAKSVVITGAKTYNNNFAPPAFPGESVICVGRSGGPIGSVLDFVSSSVQESNEEIELATDEAWRAAADTVCASVAVLIKAKAIDTELYKTLKNTTMMRNVLIRMCSGYPVHKYEEGYGRLLPSAVLEQENEQFKQLVSDEEVKKVYWSGKTIGY